MTDVVRLDDYIRYSFILVAQRIELDARRARRIAKDVDCQNIIYGLTISSVSVTTLAPPVRVFITGYEQVRLRDLVSG
jgi:hypothetical protein